MKVCTTCGKEWPDETKFCPDDGSTLRLPSGTGDLIGSVIADRYHITKKLGEGGMGAVYLGEHVKMGRKSAIKVMTQGMANDPDAIARFNREAANAARINHSNVCGIYDFGETDDGLIYLAMEFIEGEALTDLLEREGSLRPDRAANILKQCADALQAAHDLGIVHRDLKPDNIMITKTRDGSDGVKVVDFGIAKAIGGEEGQNVTKTGLVVGTPEYMSPEQLSGDKLDGRSDIYSLALVLFRMMTGGLPFRADTAQETMIKRLTDEPMKLNQVLQGYAFPPGLQEAMDRALSRMPSQRYLNADEFGKAVMAAVGEIEYAAATVDSEEATQLIDAADAAATSQMASTRVADAAVREPTPDTPQPIPQPAAGKKKTPVVAIAAGFVLLAAGSVATYMVVGSDSSGQPVAADGAQSQNTSGSQASNQPTTNPVTTTGGGNTSGGTQTQQTPTLPRTEPRATSPGPRGGGEQVQTTLGSGTPSVGDSAAVSDQLFAILETIDFGNPTQTQLDSMRRHATRVHDDARVSTNLRAEAAQLVATLFDLQDNNAGSCRWIDKALDLMPGRDVYLTLRDLWSCS